MDYQKRKAITSVCYLAWSQFFGVLLILFNFSLNDQLYALKEMFLLLTYQVVLSLCLEISQLSHSWLNLQGLTIVTHILKEGGKFIAKIFRGKDTSLLYCQVSFLCNYFWIQFFNSVKILFGLQRRPQFNVFCCRRFYILAFVLLVDC